MKNKSDNNNLKLIYIVCSTYGKLYFIINNSGKRLYPMQLNPSAPSIATHSTARSRSATNRFSLSIIFFYISHKYEILFRSAPSSLFFVTVALPSYSVRYYALQLMVRTDSVPWSKVSYPTIQLFLGAVFVLWFLLVVGMPKDHRSTICIWANMTIPKLNNQYRFFN